ncbi:unannotated protein [freshwater metagenome]|uniref:Unannotated protein n=1 Tax=freshwater metagenome TaxID=449393 RepID=A0A6J7B5V1_9ZZZZ
MTEIETTEALVLVIFKIEHIPGVDTVAEIFPVIVDDEFVLSIAENCAPFEPLSVMRPAIVVTMRVAITDGIAALSRGLTRVKLLSTGLAGANFASPDCVATTVQRTGSGAKALRKA